MNHSLTDSKMARRRMLQMGALAAGGIMTSSTFAGTRARPRGSVRDRFWLWAHAAGSHNKDWGLPVPSRITPLEAAFYMNVPNLIMVRYQGQPAPPFQQYAVPFRRLKGVVWSVVGESGRTEAEEREAVLQLAFENRNFSGVMMDDFFTGKTEGKVASLSVEELRELRRGLRRGDRRLDLWVVLYDHQLELPVTEHLQQCDVISFWTWKAEDLDKMEKNLGRAEKLTPGKRRVLGLYMYDYGTRRPMPLEAMKMQCEQGLKWLRQGRIEGMIFLATCICDLNLEAVEWTRAWIERVGDQPL